MRGAIEVRWPWMWRNTPLRLPDTPPETGAGDPPCVVHLVREANGIGSLRAFLAALRAHPPGCEYELVLAMKGFTSRAHAAPYLQEVVDLAPQALFFPDRGFDLGVYLALAARLRRDRYCFLNSHARPLVDGWLGLLDAVLRQTGVGQVGATGSWASMNSWAAFQLGLPSAYRGLLPGRAAMRDLTVGIQHEAAALWAGPPAKARHSAGDTLRMRLRSLPRIPRELAESEPFPARHLRTNTFMVRHAALRELRLWAVRSKMDTRVLESGRDSLTAQLRRMGLSSLVVDRSGRAWRSQEWDRSRTLWQGEQEGLLVADNQTCFYATGSFARRSLFSTLAWGAAAAPLPPRAERPPLDMAALAGVHTA